MRFRLLRREKGAPRRPAPAPEPPKAEAQAAPKPADPNAVRELYVEFKG